MTRTCVLSTVLGMLVYGCAMTGVTPEKTQLQIREIQTRSYDTNDTKIVMKVLLNMLQDEGFIVRNADTDLGLLTAWSRPTCADGSPSSKTAPTAGSQ